MSEDGKMSEDNLGIGLSSSEDRDCELTGNFEDSLDDTILYQSSDAEDGENNISISSCINPILANAEYENDLIVASNFNGITQKDVSVNLASCIQLNNDCSGNQCKQKQSNQDDDTFDPLKNDYLPSFANGNYKLSGDILESLSMCSGNSTLDVLPSYLNIGSGNADVSCEDANTTQKNREVESPISFHSHGMERSSFLPFKKYSMKNYTSDKTACHAMTTHICKQEKSGGPETPFDCLSILADAACQRSEEYNSKTKVSSSSARDENEDHSLSLSPQSDEMLLKSEDERRKSRNIVMDENFVSSSTSETVIVIQANNGTNVESTTIQNKNEPPYTQKESSLPEEKICEQFGPSTCPKEMLQNSEIKNNNMNVPNPQLKASLHYQDRLLEMAFFSPICQAEAERNMQMNSEICADNNNSHLKSYPMSGCFTSSRPVQGAHRGENIYNSQPMNFQGFVPNQAQTDQNEQTWSNFCQREPDQFHGYRGPMGNNDTPFGYENPSSVNSWPFLRGSNRTDNINRLLENVQKKNMQPENFQRNQMLADQAACMWPRTSPRDVLDIQREICGATHSLPYGVLDFMNGGGHIVGNIPFIGDSFHNSKENQSDTYSVPQLLQAKKETHHLHSCRRSNEYPQNSQRINNSVPMFDMPNNHTCDYQGHPPMARYNNNCNPQGINIQMNTMSDVYMRPIVPDQRPPSRGISPAFQGITDSRVSPISELCQNQYTLNYGQYPQHDMLRSCTPVLGQPYDRRATTPSPSLNMIQPTIQHLSPSLANTDPNVLMNMAFPHNSTPLQPSAMPTPMHAGASYHNNVGNFIENYQTTSQIQQNAPTQPSIYLIPTMPTLQIQTIVQTDDRNRLASRLAENQNDSCPEDSVEATEGLCEDSVPETSPLDLETRKEYSNPVHYQTAKRKAKDDAVLSKPTKIARMLPSPPPNVVISNSSSMPGGGDMNGNNLFQENTSFPRSNTYFGNNLQTNHTFCPQSNTQYPQTTVQPCGSVGQNFSTLTNRPRTVGEQVLSNIAGGLLPMSVIGDVDQSTIGTLQDILSHAAFQRESARGISFSNLRKRDPNVYSRNNCPEKDPTNAIEGILSHAAYQKERNYFAAFQKKSLETSTRQDKATYGNNIEHYTQETIVNSDLHSNSPGRRSAFQKDQSFYTSQSRPFSWNYDIDTSSSNPTVHSNQDSIYANHATLQRHGSGMLNQPYSPSSPCVEDTSQETHPVAFEPSEVSIQSVPLRTETSVDMLQPREIVEEANQMYSTIDTNDLQDTHMDRTPNLSESGQHEVPITSPVLRDSRITSASACSTIAGGLQELVMLENEDSRQVVSGPLSQVETICLTQEVESSQSKEVNGTNKNNEKGPPSVSIDVPAGVNQEVDESDQTDSRIDAIHEKPGQGTIEDGLRSLLQFSALHYDRMGVNKEDIKAKTALKKPYPQVSKEVGKARQFAISKLEIGEFKYDIGNDETGPKKVAKLKLNFNKRKVIYELELSKPESASDSMPSPLASIELSFDCLVGIVTSGREVLFEVMKKPVLYLGSRTSDKNTATRKSMAVDRSQNIDVTGTHIATCPYHKITLQKCVASQIDYFLANFDPSLKDKMKQNIVIDMDKTLTANNSPIKVLPFFQEDFKFAPLTQKKTCSCLKGKCSYGTCGCRVLGQACSAGCLCGAFTKCHNPFSMLAAYTINITRAKKDHCLMDNLSKIKNLDNYLSGGALLSCCNKSKRLWEFARQGIMKCPNNKCDNTYTYSWCKGLPCNEKSSPRQHCVHCSMCVEPGSFHCTLCNKCFHPGPEFKTPCPCTNGKLPIKQLKLKPKTKMEKYPKKTKQVQKGENMTSNTNKNEDTSADKMDGNKLGGCSISGFPAKIVKSTTPHLSISQDKPFEHYQIRNLVISPANNFLPHQSSFKNVCRNTVEKSHQPCQGDPDKVQIQIDMQGEKLSIPCTREPVNNKRMNLQSDLDVCESDENDKPVSGNLHNMPRKSISNIGLSELKLGDPLDTSSPIPNITR